jgi:hypothetical protein
VVQGGAAGERLTAGARTAGECVGEAGVGEAGAGLSEKFERALSDFEKWFFGSFRDEYSRLGMDRKNWHNSLMSDLISVADLGTVRRIESWYPSGA